MKKIYFTLIIPFLSVWAEAQTEFSLIAGELEPHDDGLYVAGVTFDFNNDGTDEFANGCQYIDGQEMYDFESYERRDPFEVTYDLHKETGTQFGYSYKNCLIMAACDAKYESTLDPVQSHGFIQIRPLIDTTDVDLAWSYIMSPYVRNIQSITMETSADVSIQPDTRHIPYNIEYSLDSGKTFVFDYYIPDMVQERGGYRATYDIDNSADLAQMNADSQDKNIILRFSGNFDTQDRPNKGQYVKIHKIVIVADSARANTGGGGGGGTGVLALDNLRSNSPITIKNNMISTSDEWVTMYALSGQVLATGREIPVRKGFYIVTTSSGYSRKFNFR